MDNKANIEYEDFKRIYSDFKFKKKYNNATVLITGFNGFLGNYLVKFLTSHKKKLKWKKLILIDNFKLNSSLSFKITNNKDVLIFKSDITKLNLNKKEFKKVDFIFHMASIASPHYYRKYPLETISANVDGLKNILEKYKNQNTNVVYFSSSEIYGDPTKDHIPTKESYRGNVSSIGPRSCYDESKRFCETLSYYYSLKYKINVKIVRPFNNYGPGMSLDDKRLPADLGKSIISNKDIILFSNGKPKRAFCYISDAITGYLQASAFPYFEIFNIGNDESEISVKGLTDIYKKVGKETLNYKGKVIFKVSKDSEYLTNNPNRRCPEISKAKKLLLFKPKVGLKQGVEKFLLYNQK